MFYIIKFIQNNKGFLLVLALALFLRLIGISHGYPYIFNVDEPTVVRSTLSLRFTAFIDHFDWPHFNYYFNYVFYFVFIKLRGFLQVIGLQKFLQEILPVLWDDPFIFYLISRVLSAFFGALTIIPIYLLSKEILEDKKAALFSAFFIAVIPFHVYFSHFALQDGSMLFWLSFGIYFAYIGILQNKVKDYLLSGLFFGLAVGIKYNAILFLVMVLAFAIEKYFKTKKDFFILLKDSLFLGVVFAITFILTTFSLIFKWSTFWSYKYGKGILWQLKYNVVSVDSSEYLGSLVKNLLEFKKDLSIFGILIVIVGFSFLIIKKKRIGMLSMAIASIVYFMYVSRFARSPSHYFLPIYAFLPIFAGYSYLYIKGKYKILLMCGIIGMFSISFWSSIKFTHVNTKTEVINKYIENYSGNIYFKGEGLDSANAINNLGFMKYTLDDILTSNNILISEEEIKDDKIKQVDYISSKNRYGGPIYVYTGN